MKAPFMSRTGFIRTFSVGLPLVLVAVVASVVVIWQVMPLTASSAPKNYLSKPAFMGDLQIVVNGNGHLEAIDSVTMSSEVERDVKILEIVNDGSFVKKGDVLCKLDSGEIQERLAQQMSDVVEADAKLIEAEKNLGVQERTNESTIEEAILNARLAELDLAAYLEGEYLQMTKKLRGELQLENEKLSRSVESLEFTKRMARKGYRSQTELEAAQLQVSQQQLTYEAKQEELRVLTDFTYERRTSELKSKAKNMKSKMERAKEQAEIEMAKVEADYATRKSQKEYEDLRLHYWERQLAACTIVAPKDGQVLYAKPQRRNYASTYEVRVGSSVYERMPIFQMPDNSAVKIKAKVHESNFPRISLKLPVNVRIEAFPTHEFKGEISYISTVPNDGEFPNFDQKYYDVEIRMHKHEDANIDIKPGLSSTFTIVSENRSGVLQVPVQSVIAIGKSTYVYVDKTTTAERRPVRLGASNDVSVEVLAGVENQERVIMNPQTTFADEIAKLQQIYSETAKTKKPTDATTNPALPATAEAPKPATEA